MVAWIPGETGPILPQEKLKLQWQQHFPGKQKFRDKTLGRGGGRLPAGI